MRWLRRNLLGIVAILVLIYLFIPIAVVAILSFNKPSGKFNISWTQFSTDAWTNLCGVPGFAHHSQLVFKLASSQQS